MKKILAVVSGAAAATVGVVFLKRSDVPQVPFAKTTRETISNVLSTNGKVEPAEYIEVRVETPGLVKRVLVHAGDSVRKDQMLAELSEPGLQQELDAATARRGSGARRTCKHCRPAEKAPTRRNSKVLLNRLKADRDAAQRNLEALQRLLAKQAATAFEVEQARQSVESLDVQIQSLQQRRAALVGKGDIASAEARVQEAEANVALARGRMRQDIIRAPMGGTRLRPAGARRFLSECRGPGGEHRQAGSGAGARLCG